MPFIWAFLISLLTTLMHYLAAKVGMQPNEADIATTATALATLVIAAVCGLIQHFWPKAWSWISSNGKTLTIFLIAGIMLSLSGCSAFFSAGGQPTIITNGAVRVGAYIATQQVLAKNPGAAADTHSIAVAVQAAIQSPPDVTALKALAVKLGAKSTFGSLIVPIISEVLDEAAQEASGVTPSAQQLALVTLAKDALAGVVDASAAAMAKGGGS